MADPADPGRRRLLRSAGAAAAVAGLAPCRSRDQGEVSAEVCLTQAGEPSRAPKATPERPPPARSTFNVLFISSDQHCASVMGHEGHPLAQTPALDRLAAEGLRCTRAHASSPVCQPTRASLLTGLNALEHGVPQNGFKLHEGYPSLVSLFRDAGMTAACFGKLHTGNDEANLLFGFDETFTYHCGERWWTLAREARAGLPASEPDPAELPLWESLPVEKMEGLPQVFLEENRDQVMTWQALEWLRQHHEQRFFLYVSLITPHHPFFMPVEFYYRYDPEQVWPANTTPPTIDDSWLGSKTYLEAGWDQMSEAQTRLCLARYLGAVSWTDHLVGQLLALLDELGLAENTLVVYTSDHGELAGEKGLWFKTLPYEGAARKPLLLRMPGHIAPGVSDDVALGEADMLPTLAGLVGAAGGLEAMGVSGRDLSAALLGEPLERPAYVFSTIGQADDEGQPLAVVAVGERYKLVRYRDYVGAAYVYELYDLATDPREDRNLAHEEACAGVILAMDEALDGFLAAQRAPSFDLELAL